MAFPDCFFQRPVAPMAGHWPLLMGIVNVTPDSFSDGGALADTDAALAYALRLVREGADIIDIGGESTRPGAKPVSVPDEVARTVPLIRELRSRLGIPISIDTSKAEVARAALDAGADIVNDVTAGSDPEMFKLCAQRQCILSLMHMQGTPRDMQADPHYENVVQEVAGYLQRRVDAAVKAGVAPSHLWIDPGFGFGKLPRHNLELVQGLQKLSAMGFPVVLGVSRKSTLGHLTGAPVNDREPESLAAGLVGALQGAAVLRVHEVGWMKRAVKVAKAMLQQGDGWSS